MRAVFISVLAAMLLAASPAAADESALEAYEIATLGPEHAAEHTRERAVARAALHASPAQKRAAAMAVPKVTAPADQVGRWDPSTVSLPTFAINAVMLPTGKVAFWGRAPLDANGARANRSEFWLWDPATGGLTRRDPPPIDLDGDGQLETPAPLFCSGQSLLRDGQLFVAGGTLGNPGYLGGSTPNWRGLDRAYTFDPWSLTWQEQPRPRHGRWYPTQVELADGRIAILAGFDETGTGTKNPEMEVFTPPARRGGIGTLTYFPAGNRDTAFYPHMFTMPGGKVLMGGPDRFDSALLDPAALPRSGSAWTDLAPTNRNRVGGNAVLWGGSRVTLLGGFDFVPQGGDAVADTETFDAADPGAGWTLNGKGVPRMNVARSYGNVVQLPNGELVAVGGGAGNRSNNADSNYTADDQRLKQVELLRPDVDHAWRLGPAQRKWRAYHSTALLLPDGRVLSAGDDYWHLGDQRRPEGGDPMDVGEIYSPPYLFDGDQPAVRPEIEDAPAAVRYGVPFGVTAPDAVRVVLVAPSATTHGNDMNQRLVQLDTVRGVDGVGLDVRSPAGPDVAPPGYYMLFALDAAGTPSDARWVRVGVDAPMPDTLPDPTQTSTPLTTAAPSGKTLGRVDRTPPRAKLTFAQHGRRLVVRVRLNEAGRATLQLRVGARTIRRTLTFPRARERTVTVTASRRATRVTVSVRASDKAGNSRRVARSFRISATP